MDRKVRDAQEAKNQILPLYQEANAVKTLGTAPHPELYHQLADLREHMGRDDEAAAWHQMVLEYQPDDKESNDAIARLNAEKVEFTAVALSGIEAQKGGARHLQVSTHALRG